MLETLVAELDGEVLLDKDEITLEEDDVGCAELEDEVWLDETTCCSYGVSKIHPKLIRYPH